MVPRVTFCAPSPVKIIHVTYKLEHVWSVSMDYMAVTVIYRVPPTVMTVYVKERMEHALHVNQDGLENIVTQVSLTIIIFMKIYMKVTLIVSLYSLAIGFRKAVRSSLFAI